MIYTSDRHKRVKNTGEIFTAPLFIQDMIKNLKNIKDLSKLDKSETWLDPTCGTGNFLVELSNFTSYQNLYGVDLMEDNVAITIERLYNIYKTDNKIENDKILKTLKNNIQQGDAISFNYSKISKNKFDNIVGNPPYNGKIVKNSSIYGEIIVNAAKFLKDNGKMAMLHPGLWRLKKGNKKLHDFYKSHSVKVKTHDTYFSRYIWNIVSDIDEIYLTKNNISKLEINFECIPINGKDNNYKECNDKFEDVTEWFEKYPIPTRNFDIFQKFIKTDESQESFPKIIKVNKDIAPKNIQKNKDNVFKYPVVQKILKEKRFHEGLFYTDSKPDYQPKLILSWGSLHNLLDIKGEYQAKASGNFYLYDTPERLEELYEVLDDPVFKRLMITFHGGDQKIIIDQRFKNLHLFTYFKRDFIYEWKKIKKERNLKEDYFFHKVSIIKKSKKYDNYVYIAKQGLTWEDNEKYFNKTLKIKWYNKEKKEINER